MKTTSYLYLLFFAGCLLSVISCKKSFLNVNAEGTTLESNYYSSPDEAFAGLVAAYNPLAWTVVSSYAPKMVLLSAASDETYAGGGSATDNPGIQAWNNYTLEAATPNVPPDLWSRNYTGIYRANVMLEKTGNVPGLSDDLKARYIAEMKFLRAYYYFDLVREFGNIPLITTVLQSNESYNQVQVKPSTVYVQIEKDLNDAIPNLPATVAAAENGRVTKGAAQALLGKAIIYQNVASRMPEAGRPSTTAGPSRFRTGSMWLRSTCPVAASASTRVISRALRRRPTPSSHRYSRSWIARLRSSVTAWARS